MPKLFSFSVEASELETAPSICPFMVPSASIKCAAVEPVPTRVGTGSTAAHFIDALGTMKGQIEGAVSSSDASTEKLKSLGITVFDLNAVDRLGIYVDGADEINDQMRIWSLISSAPST